MICHQNSWLNTTILWHLSLECDQMNDKTNIHVQIEILAADVFSL